MRLRTSQLVRLAWRNRLVVPAFNIPYLPMMAPTVRALRDTHCLGLIMLARMESSIAKAQQAVYGTVVGLMHNELKIAGSADTLNGAAA